MGKKRADLGFEDALADFDPSEWQPSSSIPRSARLKTEETVRVAAVSGFKSREPKVPESSASEKRNKPRRRRTGRNAQFNLKATPDTIEAYCAIADAQGWGLGETLEYAVELLQREYGQTQQG